MFKQLSQLSFIAVLASSLLIGCTIDPYTEEKKVSNTAKGAGIGAVAGAATGAVIAKATGGKAGEGAIIGAVAGGAIGGGIGYYMDRQEAQLRHRLRGTGVSVTRNGDNIILNMPGNVLFETDSNVIQPGAHDVLTSVALVLAEFDKNYAHVNGYTDSTGSTNHNRQLSQARADSVRSYLVGQGASADKLLASGYGEASPIASNNTPEGRRLNRRVEINIAPTP